MIVSSILGGLGNQMFQYAAGKALALERGDRLMLDISGFERYGRHQGFQLPQAFCGDFNVATSKDVQSILGWQRRPLIRRILSRPAAAPWRKKGWVVEPHFQYWNGLHSAPANCCLQGYWQSEKYFHAHAAALRSDFAFKPPLSTQAQVLATTVRHQNAVSLHVRRGDYAQDAATTALHGLCSLDYYAGAIQHMRDRVDNPVFYVFSDDMPWVKAQLKVAAPMHYVELNAQAYDDMHLMSLCKHHVIANSSFSWWGAWLNPDPAKLVVAPARWFAQARCTDDLLPSAWVKL